MQYQGSYDDLKFEKYPKIHVWKGQSLLLHTIYMEFACFIFIVVNRNYKRIKFYEDT